LKAQANRASTEKLHQKGRVDREGGDQTDDEQARVQDFSLDQGGGLLGCAHGESFQALPNRPAGRTSRTMTMMTKTTTAGGFRVEHPGQALDQPQPDAGDDGAQDGTHAADDHYREDDDDQVGAHQRIHLEDRCRQYACKGRQGDAVTVSEGDQQGHVDAQGLDHLRVFGAGAQVGAQAGLLDHVPGAEAHGQGGDDDPGAVDRQEHEAQVNAAGECLGHFVGLTGDAELVAEHAFDDQGQPEGQQQAVEMVELVELAQHGALEDHPEQADQQRGSNQAPPSSSR
jgi:hypothetical protein